MSGRLKGKVAIVTGAGCVGAGWGNGRAVAVRFAQEGASVFAVDKNAEAMEETLFRIKQFEGDVTSWTCDATQNDDIQEMVDACIAKYGKIDILVNNIGGSRKGGPVELTEDEWDAQLDFNLKSVFLACKYTLPLMVKQGGGAIVNTASTSGIRWTGAAQVGYASAKAAIIQFSKVVAVEYAPKLIRVNTVVPGQMHTPMVETRLAGQRAGGNVEKLLAQRQARIPLGFMGDGRDTANAALFLASDEARFITGTELIVDGGMSARCD